jgi:hypothetical protein
LTVRIEEGLGRVEIEALYTLLEDVVIHDGMRTRRIIDEGDLVLQYGSLGP